MGSADHPARARASRKVLSSVKKTKPGRERRRTQRVHLKLPISYSRNSAKDHYGGIVGNASEGGILVHLPDKLDPGEVLKIEILFAKGWELRTVRGDAKIVWSDLAIKKHGKVHRYGLQFQLFNKKNLQKLRILLKEAIKTE
jgi:hypothetical protein